MQLVCTCKGSRKSGICAHIAAVNDIMDDRLLLRPSACLAQGSQPFPSRASVCACLLMDCVCTAFVLKRSSLARKNEKRSGGAMQHRDGLGKRSAMTLRGVTFIPTTLTRATTTTMRFLRSEWTRFLWLECWHLNLRFGRGDSDRDEMDDCCDVCFRDQGDATMLFCCGLEMCIPCWCEHRRRYHEPEPEVGREGCDDGDGDSDKCNVCFREVGEIAFVCCGMSMCHKCWVEHKRVSHDPEPEVQV